MIHGPERMAHANLTQWTVDAAADRSDASANWWHNEPYLSAETAAALRSWRKKKPADKRAQSSGTVEV